MDYMAGRARVVGVLLAFLGLAVLQACAGGAAGSRPTVRPQIRVTPAATQDVGGTATAFALQIVPTPTPAGLYTVRPGDTLSKIANTFQTSVEEIMALN